LSGANSLIYPTYGGGDAYRRRRNGMHLGFGITVDATAKRSYGTDVLAASTFPGWQVRSWDRSIIRKALRPTSIRQRTDAAVMPVYSCYIPGASNATGARIAVAGCSTNCQAYVAGSTQSRPDEVPGHNRNAFQTVLKQLSGRATRSSCRECERRSATPDYCSYYGGPAMDQCRRWFDIGSNARRAYIVARLIRRTW